LMLEPTETEGKETLDRFAAVMEELAQKATSSEGADELHEAPQNTPVTRLDETQAARKPVLRWQRQSS
ncbi:MAG TPA: aminomethyl-transferring glycine dehydrogenase subunit GcvPB, partial [Synergistaceae bacterium]|nr:aminomethyl-transferring glycine dehydrogenase subunit GcvPB [Synergistaceae bacterium]